VSVDVADSDEAADEALLRRLRKAICPERSPNLDADAQLEDVLRMLNDHPDVRERGRNT
jgi:hypothetical protein